MIKTPWFSGKPPGKKEKGRREGKREGGRGKREGGPRKTEASILPCPLCVSLCLSVSLSVFVSVSVSVFVFLYCIYILRSVSTGVIASLFFEFHVEESSEPDRRRGDSPLLGAPPPQGVREKRAAHVPRVGAGSLAIVRIGRGHLDQRRRRQQIEGDGNGADRQYQAVGGGYEREP